MTKTSFTHKSESAHTELGSLGEGKVAHMNRWLMWSRRGQARACDLGSNGRWPSTARDWRKVDRPLFVHLSFSFTLFYLFWLFIIYFTFDLFNILHIYELHWKLWWTQKNFIWIFWLAEKISYKHHVHLSRLFPHEKAARKPFLWSHQERNSRSVLKDMENYESKRSNDHV